MIPRHLLLAALIRDERTTLNEAALRIERFWQRAATADADQDAFVGATALHLHAFYTGLERLFEEIAKQLDGGVLGGAAWHAELLDQMALDLPGVRPPVLDRQSVTRLDEYRKFRHRVRHVYAMNLLPERMAALVSDLPDTAAAVFARLEAFCGFLEQLSRADEVDGDRGSTEP